MIWKVNGYSDCSSFLLDEYEDKKMSRFCEQCGKRLEVNENFCPSCGAKVFNEELRAQPPPPKTTSPPVIDNSFGKLIMGILGGIGIIFFIIVVIAGSSSQNSTSEKYDTPTRAPVETAKPPDPLTESDLRIGDLSLTSAANKTELDRRFGAGKVRDNGWYDYGDFWAKFDSSGNVYWLSYMNSNHSTPRGIHCGSTLAEIESAYGKNYLREENDYEYGMKDTSLIFHIGKKTGKVEEIVLVKKIQEPKLPVGKTNTPAEKPEVSITLNEADITIDGLILGTTKKTDIEKRFGVIEAVEPVEYGKFRCGMIEFHFTVWSDLLDLLICNDPNIKTARGIHIGSTFAEVEKAYGKNYQTYELPNGKGTQYAYVSENIIAKNIRIGTLTFDIDKDTSRVSRFGIVAILAEP